MAVLIWLNSLKTKLFFIDELGIRVEQYLTEELSPDDLIAKLSGQGISEWVILGTRENHKNFNMQKTREFPSSHVIGWVETNVAQDSEILSIGRLFLQKFYKGRKHAFDRRKI